MTEPIITNEFPKQPREKIWVPIHFSEQLESLGEGARTSNPVEIDTIHADLTVEFPTYDSVSMIWRALVGGGLTGRKYTLTVWMNTVSGARHEHEVTIKVKEQTK